MGILETMDAKLDLILAKLDSIGATPPIEPPIIEPPIVIPPVIPPTGDVLDLDKFLSGKSGVVWMPDGTTKVKSKGMIKPNKVTVLIGNGLTPTFPNWGSTPTQLFDLDGCPEFAVVGITFVTPPNRPICTGFPDKELFGWNKDSVQTGKFAWINGPEIKDKERVTFGLCRFGYSSNSEGRIYLIGKNVHHNGFNFTQIKNPYAGNLHLILQNVTVHNPILTDAGGPTSSPSSMYYSPSSFKVRIQVTNRVAKIISNNTYNQILTWVGYNYSNQRSLLHFDRYVFDINEENIIDVKNVSIGGNAHNRPTVLVGENIICSDIDLSPNDNLYGYGKIISKQIDAVMVEKKNQDGSTWWDRRSNWTYKFEPNALPTQINYPQGEFDAYIVYKGNAMFDVPITKDTKFGSDHWESGFIIQSQGYGFTVYDEEHSGYLENVEMTGYLRLSGGSGITQGLTIRNCSFEKNPKIATADEDIPKEAKEYIDYLESL